MTVEPTAFYTVQGWMVSELGLKGNALAVYAIIYGFTQDGASEYAGSSRYLCEWLGCSKKTVLTTLADLTERGLLVKVSSTKNGVPFCNYRATRCMGKEIEPPRQPKEPEQVKHQHGEYSNVLLTNGELAHLQAEFPADWLQRINRLSEYIKSSGKSYKSHYATIRMWASRDKERDKNAANGAQIGPNGIAIDPTNDDLADYF